MKVSDYSYIGANSTINKVKIGKGAIVGAGSVVVKDGSNDVVAGVPAKSIKN